MEVLRNDAIATRLDSKEVAEKLRETEATLRNAEARVAQMQQKARGGVPLRPGARVEEGGDR